MDLGEQIELVDFSSDSSELIVLKKIIGNYVKRLSERNEFERLVLTHKSVHTNKHEIHGRLIANGQECFCDVSDNNIFFAVDECLKKLQNQLR